MALDWRSVLGAGSRRVALPTYPFQRQRYWWEAQALRRSGLGQVCDHPLLGSEHVTIAPHLGSATEQTRQKMAEISVENLFRGLRGQPLLHRVQP